MSVEAFVAAITAVRPLEDHGQQHALYESTPPGTVNVIAMALRTNTNLHDGYYDAINRATAANQFSVFPFSSEAAGTLGRDGFRGCEKAYPW